MRGHLRDPCSGGRTGRPSGSAGVTYAAPRTPRGGGGGRGRGSTAKPDRVRACPAPRSRGGRAAAPPAASGAAIAPRRSAAVGGQRLTRGIPRPIQEMISRWISLLPPPKVKITADR
ncbi:hypothetical protein SCWH03_07450 [Streptomyces pacificus]|uniref:Uncharacterized protein n=1 Tax=Streptomyces pacificus TaxID=2705029 RepID=A0A6A0AQJ2_9ACTN|nr:hypothetical protein SCWH03_07450 [Streptomyces pacificus]